METLFVYLEKSSGLIALFYLAYFFLLRKETFFNSNRWFLLAGIITSTLLPLLFYTKIIWVNPSPTNLNWSNLPVTTPIENESFEINWYLIFGIVYGIGIVLFLLKLVFDLYSLSKILKGKTIQKQDDFKFIDVTENISPFSYLNYIVYNSTLYSDTELENILEHEKVHSTQIHTADVLISRLFCIAFWFNPFVWFYTKAIAQNLEFIADSEASKNSSDKKAYQLTLLKITTQENCVALTNHFYQSLIKKRIVMLNKNQSKKRNSLKYIFVLPLIGAFVFFFQVKVVAQEKSSKNTTKNKSEITITIDKNFSDKELKKETELFKKEYDCDLIFSEIERNSDNEIIGITVNYNKNIYGNGTFKQHSKNTIEPFYIKRDVSNKINISNAFLDKKIDENKTKVNLKDKKSNTKMKEIFINGSKESQEELDKLNPNEIESMNVINNKNQQEIRIVTKKLSKVLNDNHIYINDEKTDKNELLLLDQITIDKIDVNSEGKTIRITTNNNAQSLDNFEIKNTSKQKPIIIINGKRTEASMEDINKLDPNLIQSMNILKGKNAIEKYGKEGKNGAIEINTKENVDILKLSNKKDK